MLQTWQQIDELLTTACNTHICSFFVRFAYLIGVYLSLNRNVLPSHSYLEMNDIGSANETALLCITSYLYNGSDEVANWFGPDDTRVRYIDCQEDQEDNYNYCKPPLYPGFGRNRARARGIVRLIRNPDSGDPLEGMYRCEILDTTSTLQTVYVGLYNMGQGRLLLIIASVIVRLTKPPFLQ